jgi:hypothetical protein
MIGQKYFHNRIIAINSPIIEIIEKHRSAIFGWVFIAQKRQKAGSDRTSEIRHQASSSGTTSSPCPST